MKQKSITILSFLFVFFLSALTSVSQQNGTYQLESDVCYRAQSESQNNPYLAERCKLDVYYPENTSGFATVVWFHGGGITGGEKHIPEKLMGQGIAVVAVNYHLNPKVKCPVYIDDAAAAVAWVFKNIADYGGDKSKIIVAGHSAGGYLASMVGLDKSYLREFGIDANEIALLVPFSGHTITHFTVRAERGIGGTQPVIDQFAPLCHVRADGPPLVLISGDRELEMLGRYEENAYMWRMMKVAGHKNTKLYELDSFDHSGMYSPALEILLNEAKVLD